MSENQTPGSVAAAFRRHPVYQLVRDSAYHGKRGLPTKAELDAIGLSAAQRDRLELDCLDVAEIHDEGEHAKAWALADELAGDFIDALPDKLRDPDAFKTPEDLSGLGPAELAARVPRH